MATRIRAQFQTERGQIWTILIDDADHSGAVTTMEVAPPGFTLSYAGGEDIFHPVIPSTVTLPLLIQDATGNTFLSDLMTADEGRFRMVIRKGDGDNTLLWWVGVLTLDNITISDAAYPQLVEVQAVDGLQILSRVEYDNPAASPSISDVLIYCLKKAGTSDLFVTSGIDLMYLTALTSVAPDVATYDDPLTDVKLNPGVWNPLTQSYDYDMSVEQVLIEICRAYNSRLCLSNGTFHFHSIDRQISTQPDQTNLRKFKADGTESSQALTDMKETVGVPGTSLKKLAGWERSSLTPVSQVVRPLMYGEGDLVSNFNVGGAALVISGATSGTSVATYTVSSANTFPAGSTFNIQGLVDITAEFLALSGDNRCGRAKVVVTLQVGTYSLHRDMTLNANEFTQVNADDFVTVPTTDESVLVWNDSGVMNWQQNTTGRIHYGSDVLNYDRKHPVTALGQDDDTQIQLDITTPPTPVALPVDVTLSVVVVLFDSNGSSATQAKKDGTTADVLIQLRSGEGQNGNSILYLADNDNGATEVRDESHLSIGSQVVFTNQYYYNPAELYNVNGGLPDWTSTLTTSAQQLHAVGALDIARYLAQPKQVHVGSLVIIDTTILHMYQVLYIFQESRHFLPVSMTLNADSQVYELEVHELGDASDAPTSSVVKPEQPKPVPVLSAFDALNKRVNRETRSGSRQFIQTAADLAVIVGDVSTNAQGISTNQTNISTESTRLGNLEKKIEGEALDKLGVFSNIADDTKAGLKIDSQTLARIRGGDATQVTLEQTSPGTITMSVAAGANDTETQCVRITGAANGSTTTLVSSSDLRVTGNASFSNGSGTVSFSGATSGIDYNDLNNTPSGGGGGGYGDRYATEAETARNGATADVELYYTARPDGDGLAQSAISDSGVTDTINRTLYFATKFDADPDTSSDWTEYTTQPADNATFTTAKAALLAGLNETDGTANTRGTLPLSLKIVRTTTAAANLLLDVYTNAAAAFSVRKLRTAYSGSCLRVVRQNDGSEQDIGFDNNGLLDVAAIANFCGTASGKVSIFYDQSGNGDNAVQPTGQRQPDIYNGSGVFYVNGKPALSFVRSSLESLKIDNSGLDIGTLTSMCVMRFNSTTSGQVGLSLSGNSASYPNKRWYAPYYSGNGASFYYFHGSTNVSTSADQDQHLHSMIKRPNYDAAPSLDGTTLSAISSTATGVDLATDVGMCFWNNSFHADANQQEVVYWNSDQTANRSAIESNIMTYFGI